MTKVGKWDVPTELYEAYIKFRMFADNYADPKYVDSNRMVPMLDQERTMRWSLCVQKVMELHRQICESIGVPYSEHIDNEFYQAFVRQVHKDMRLKG